MLGAVAVAVIGYWRFCTAPRPNLLLITLDTTRADRIGAYGCASALTPVLDQLAAEGVLFERAYSPAPLTLPVHASLLTGLYPPEHGLRTNGAGSLPQALTTLSELLARCGYDTGAFVGSFVLDGKFGLKQGFDVYDDELVGAQPTQESLHRQRDGKLVVDAALKWLHTPRSKPFFCWVHLYDPHAPYDAHSEVLNRAFDDSPYDGEIAYVDRQVGRLMDFLKQHPRSVVIVAGDHGESLGDHAELNHGYTLYNSTQHVPLIFHGARDSAPGARVSATVSLVDVFPTVLELVKLPVPDGVSGRSLVAGLSGKSMTPRANYGMTDDPFLENGWSPLRSLTTERWRYIRTAKPELYDLQADPQELNNLAADEPKRLAELEAQLAELESSLTVGKASSVQLSSAEQRALASLGYVGGTTSAASLEANHLPDVKDMLPFNLQTQQAATQMEQGNLAEAQATLERVVAEAPPEHYSSRITLGFVYERLGRDQDAEELYQAVLKHHPDHTTALLHLGALCAKQARYAEATLLFKKSLTTEADAAQSLFNLGLIQARQGNYQQAEREFRELLRVDPSFPGAWVSLGNMLGRQGRTAESILAYESELKIDPTSIEARVNLGVQLARQKRLRESRQHLEEAVRLAPQDTEALFNLAVCCEMQGDSDRALQLFEEVLRRNPNHARAAAELERMRGAGKFN